MSILCYFCAVVERDSVSRGLIPHMRESQTIVKSLILSFATLKNFNGTSRESPSEAYGITP